MLLKEQEEMRRLILLLKLVTISEESQLKILAEYRYSEQKFDKVSDLQSKVDLARIENELKKQQIKEQALATDKYIERQQLQVNL